MQQDVIIVVVWYDEVVVFVNVKLFNCIGDFENIDSNIFCQVFECVGILCGFYFYGYLFCFKVCIYLVLDKI